MSANLVARNGALAVLTPYNPAFVADLKAAIPYAGRKWDQASKAWLVDPAYGPQVATLIQQHYGEQVSVPQIQVLTIVETKMVKLEYLGQCKDRDGTSTASGYADGGWNLVFPEHVLRTWFADPKSLDTQTKTAPAIPSTLYAVLTVQPTAQPEHIKKAYRQLARQWHPDVCREPDASDRFKRITEAYDVLSNPQKRKRYDAGLKFEASQERQAVSPLSRAQYLKVVATATNLYNDYGYRSPLRCGLLMVEGQTKLGQFVVSNILAWEDIVRADGRVMMTSWQSGAKTFDTHWVQP